MSSRRGRAIYVAIEIAAPVERVWELTQDPAQHTRWDLRFSRIVPEASSDGPAADLPSGRPTRFRYERRLPGHTIAGTGISLGDRSAADGTRTSALRFTTRDRLSPLRDGRGYWRYRPTPRGTLFVTGFDYVPGWGGLLDRLVVRPLVGRMTAWSFDRLRIWAESGVAPERWPVASAVRFWRHDRPRASRCTRTPPGRADAMRGAPASLEALEAP
nr:hypothetical protein [uncultured organism]